jgi:hypothetical protein
MCFFFQFLIWRCPHIILKRERGGCCVKAMLVSCAGVSLHQFRAYTSSVCSIHSQGRHGNQGCGAKKQRWRFQEDSAAKESCVTLHEPRRALAAVKLMMCCSRQASMALFFSQQHVLHLTPVCHSLYSHHTCRMSQKAQTQFINQHLAKKFYTFNSSNLYSVRKKISPESFLSIGKPVK